MTQKICGVVRDLLGRWCAGDCSDETRQFVSEHLSECEECAALAAQIQTTQQNTKNTALSVQRSFPLLLAGTSMLLVFAIHLFPQNAIPLPQILASFGVCLGGVLLFALLRGPVHARPKADAPLVCGSALLLAASAAAIFWLSACCLRGTLPSFIATDRLAPLLNVILTLCALGQGLLFAAQAVRLFRGHGAGWALCLSATGFYLPLSYHHGVLMILSDPDALFPALGQVTLVTACIGLAGVCLSLVLAKFHVRSGTASKAG